jgi:hypothetical protein
MRPNAAQCDVDSVAGALREPFLRVCRCRAHASLLAISFRRLDYPREAIEPLQPRAETGLFDTEARPPSNRNEGQVR